MLGFLRKVFNSKKKKKLTFEEEIVESARATMAVQDLFDIMNRPPDTLGQAPDNHIVHGRSQWSDFCDMIDESTRAEHITDRIFHFQRSYERLMYSKDLDELSKLKFDFYVFYKNLNKENRKIVNNNIDKYILVTLLPDSMMGEIENETT